MIYTDQEIEKLVCQHFKQKAANAVEAGPKVAGHYVWRVWTKDAREFHAHYAAAKTRGDVKYFQNYPPFANWLNEEYEKLNLAALAELPTIVASIAILAGIGLVAFVVAKNPSALPVAGMVTAIFVGAGGFLFGRQQGRRARTPEI